MVRPKCDTCNDPSDYNFQEVFITYAIVVDKESQGGFRYEELDAVNIGDNLFYCQKCAEGSGYI